MNPQAILSAASPLFLADIAAIDASDRLRPVEEAHARWIAASIAEVGQIEPVTLRAHPAGDGTTLAFKLVAGAHRLRAVEINGDGQIAAILIECSDDEARQIEIDENLARRELTVLERSEFMMERKRVYERLHPEAAHGKAKKPKKGKVANLATFQSFAKDAAKNTGLSERTVRRACELFGKLAPEATALIRGTKVADNQAQLQALAELEPEQQKLVAGLLAAKGAGTVAKARVAAGLVPEGGAVRAEDRPLVKLEPLLRRLSLDNVRAVRALCDQIIAAAEASAKPARARKGSRA